MVSTEETLIISTLAVVVLILVLQIELYRTLLNLLQFYSPEAPPPAELRFSPSFLSTLDGKGSKASSHSKAKA